MNNGSQSIVEIDITKDKNRKSAIAQLPKWAMAKVQIERNVLAKMGPFNALAKEVVRRIKGDATHGIPEMNSQNSQVVGSSVPRSQWQYNSRRSGFDGIITGGDKGAPVMKNNKNCNPSSAHPQRFITLHCFHLKICRFPLLRAPRPEPQAISCQKSFARRMT